MTKNYIADMILADEIEAQSNQGKKKLYDRIGGRPMLDKVHTIFYDKLYAHPWLGQLFSHVDQQHIESQQSDFVAHLMGGPKNYCGRMPIDAHMHMMITEEMFELRHDLLRDSLVEAGLEESEIAAWLKLDLAFKKVLVKESVAQCEKRYATDEIVDVANPFPQAKAS